MRPSLIPMSKLLVLLLCAALAGCSQHHSARHHRHRIKTLPVCHTHDGRYVYRDDGGMFWYYMYLTSSPDKAYSTPSASYDYYTTPVPVTLPAGGVWVSTNELSISEPQERQLELELNDPRAEVLQEPVEVTDSGNLIDTEIHEEQLELELSDPEAAETTSDTPSESSDSSSDSGSTGGDSSSSDGGSPGESA